MRLLNEELVMKNSADKTLNSSKNKSFEVKSPVDGAIIGVVKETTKEHLDRLVNGAEVAFKTWSAFTLKERAQVFYKYKVLLENNIRELSELIHLENGKTINEANAEIEKAIESCEFAISLPQIISNETQEVSKGIECTSERRPLGVFASITPFNFPSMVPHWTIPNALVLGNTMLLKPSEKVPLSMLKITSLLQEAGLPEGVFSVVNGGKNIVEAICDHPKIKAISFVGSTHIAKKVYQRATSNLKRCLALGGAKNHLIVLPDADVETTVSNILASVIGCTGQRCMAASVMLGVGEIQHIIDKMIVEAKSIIPGIGLGAVISEESKNRIENYISEAENLRARILLDGRNIVVEGKENGFYVGPTIIDYVNYEMPIATEEIFGPVIVIIRVDTIDDALAIENTSIYGNAAAVFTQNGSLAKRVANQVSSGMVGINIATPVPRAPFSFGGWNQSKFGVGDITGKSSIEFWTQLKKTTSKWNFE